MLYETAVVRSHRVADPEKYRANDRRRFDKAAMTAAQRCYIKKSSKLGEKWEPEPVTRMKEKEMLRDRAPKDRIRSVLPGFRLLHSRNLPTRKIKLSIRSDATAIIVGLSLAGLIYGGLHELAWQAPFTSHVQMMLWRVSAATLTAYFGGLIALVPCLRLLLSLIMRVDMGNFTDCMQALLSAILAGFGLFARSRGFTLLVLEDIPGD